MRTSVMVKLGTMGILFIVLLAPIEMVRSLTSERTERRDEAADAVIAVWGGAQVVTGAALTVPFQFTIEKGNGQREEVEDRATFLPERVEARVTLAPEIRRRGLFGVPVYRATIQMNGEFRRPDIGRLITESARVNWPAARVAIGITDPRGIAGPVALTWNGAPQTVEPGATEPSVGPGVSAAAPGTGPDGPETLPFSFAVELNGTRAIEFAPLGINTVVTMQSSWPHPGFQGALPYRHDITNAGFTAEWRVTNFATAIPPSWRSRNVDYSRLRSSLEKSAFGVTLVQPVDIYQQTERAVKYAVLFLVLTFVIAFLWEIVGGVLVHGVQYVFIGFALCVFYVLLLAISEHWGFDIAYISASVPTILLITWYWQWVIHARARAFLMLAALTGLYGYLYLLLQLEDYSLLGGAVGLFISLAAVMFLTRRVDWYNLKIGLNDEAA